MRGNRKDKISVVEATYAPAHTEKGWLTGILDAAGPLICEGMGAAAYVYEGAEGAVRIGARVAHGLDYPLDDFVLPIETLPPAFLDRTWRSLSFGMCSDVIPVSEMPQAKPLHDAGIRDVVNINAYDASGFGVCIGVPLPAERRRRPREEETWTRVAAHLASAYRLFRRSTLLPSPEAATAVLDPKGRLQHAADGETADRIRASLESAVLRMERARGAMRRTDPDEALGLWRTLVDSELTLLDHFERGGKRYVVAVANPPREEGGHSVLSRRERQVVAAAASGRSNKLIAYELGLAHSTVRVLLARAAHRLHAKSREELVAIHRAHERARLAPKS